MKRLLLAIILGAAAGPLLAQGPPISLPPRPPPNGPMVIDTAEQKIRVTAVKGLSHPWSLAFLPNGDRLVTDGGPSRWPALRADG